MSNGNTKELLSRVYDLANELFPELKVRMSDLSQPTETFLVKFLIQYLRGFGFRIEPTFNVDCEGDTSRDRRIFLIKLCRHTQNILQISVATKTFTYMDIIKPTPKKTASCLELLMNYWCYYKMYKKEVFNLVEDRIIKRETLNAAIELKYRELEERKQRKVQLKDNIANSEENITKLSSELHPAQLENRKQQKTLQQQKEHFEMLEKQLAETNAQVRHWEQLSIADSNAMELKQQIEKVVANIDACKTELSHQSQILKERKDEIESNQAISKGLDACLELTPHMLEEYKENFKQLEREENQFEKQESKHKQLQLSLEKRNQIMEQTTHELKVIKQQQEQEAQKMLRRNEEQAAVIEQQTKRLEELEEHKSNVEDKLESQEQLTKFMENQLAELFANSQ